MTAERIASDLRALGVRRGDVLLVHSSLSALSGPGSMVVGGAIAVLDALDEAVGPEGTLAMPAFSSDYSDPASWTNSAVPASWWPAVRDGMPAWRKDRARTFGIGVVAEAFRSVASRSDHPQASFCARGAQAAALVGPLASFDDPLGPKGPLGRLRSAGAKVALLGCGFRSCTCFHLAEHECARPPTRITQAAPVLRNGAREWIRWSQPAYDPRRFAEIGDAFAETGDCHTGRVGAAPAYLFDLGRAVAFAASLLGTANSSKNRITPL